MYERAHFESKTDIEERKSGDVASRDQQISSEASATFTSNFAVGTFSAAVGSFAFGWIGSD